MKNEKRRLAAIMLTDIVGYSALTQKNEELALELLEKHRRIVRPLLEKYHGKEIKTIGDAFLVEFSSAVEAVKCAIDIQTKIQKKNTSLLQERKVLLRIGIHLGDIVHRNGDIYGDGVNITARVEPIAEPGGICITDQVFSQIRNKINYPVVSIGKPQLKNIESPVEIFKVLLPWQGKPLEKPKTVHSLFSSKRLKWLYSLPLIALLVGIFLWFVIFQKQCRFVSSQDSSIDSIAVLPLQNLSGDPEKEYLADGMTEALISELSKIKALKVISRTSVMRYKNTVKPLPEIARELNVGAVIEGSALVAEGRIRITAQLIEAATDRHLWSENYNRNLKNILMLQSDVAQAIAREIRIKLTPEEKSKITNTRPVDPEAYDAFLRGRFFINKFTEEAVRKGIEFFEQAKKLDPEYALAYAGAAEAYDILTSAGWIPPSEGWPLVKGEALKAQKIDDSLAITHTLLAEVKLVFDWDWEGAEREYRRAIELNPGNAVSHQYYAIFLSAMDRHEEAIEENKRALELDPLSLSINQTLGTIYRFSRQYDLSIEKLEQTLQLDPNFAFTHWSLGEVYLLKQMFEEAIAAYQKALSLSSGSVIIQADLARAYALSGKKTEARKILEDLKEMSKHKYVSPFYIATIYIAEGEKEMAFEWLEKAYAIHSNNLVLLKVDPRLDKLRTDSRFQDLLIKMGFSE